MDPRFTKAQRFKDCLQSWVDAMRDGTASHRYPVDTPAIDSDKVALVITTLMTGELLREATRTGKIVPPFDKLPDYAQLALIQDLIKVFRPPTAELH